MKSDSNRFRQILFNLINNSIKFTSKGSIKVVASLEEKEGVKTNLSCSVADTGIGIKEEDLVKMFKLFGKLEGNKASNP